MLCYSNIFLFMFVNFNVFIYSVKITEAIVCFNYSPAYIVIIRVVGAAWTSFPPKSIMSMRMFVAIRVHYRHDIKISHLKHFAISTLHNNKFIIASSSYFIILKNNFQIVCLYFTNLILYLLRPSYVSSMWPLQELSTHVHERHLLAKQQVLSAGAISIFSFDPYC